MLSTCEQQQVGHTNVQLDFVYMNRIRVWPKDMWVMYYILWWHCNENIYLPWWSQIMWVNHLLLILSTLWTLHVHHVCGILLTEQIAAVQVWVFLNIHVVCGSNKFYLILCVIIDDEYNTTNKTKTNYVHVKIHWSMFITLWSKETQEMLRGKMKTVWINKWCWWSV